jgi:hypothetical protein
VAAGLIRTLPSSATMPGLSLTEQTMAALEKMLEDLVTPVAWGLGWGLEPARLAHTILPATVPGEHPGVQWLKIGRL